MKIHDLKKEINENYGAQAFWFLGVIVCSILMVGLAYYNLPVLCMLLLIPNLFAAFSYGHCISALYNAREALKELEGETIEKD